MKRSTATLSCLACLGSGSSSRWLAILRSLRLMRLSRPASAGLHRPLSTLAAALATTAILSLSSASALADVCRPYSGPREAVLVREAIDGDSLVLRDGTQVRIIGINTTEISGKLQPAPYSLRARRHVRRRLRDSDHRIYLYPGSEKHDRYGRRLAYVVLEDGRDLGEDLLLAGLAAAVYIPPNTYRAECYRNAERRARSYRRGLWSTDSPFHRRFQVIEGKIRHFQRGQGSLVVYIGAQKLPVSILTRQWQPDPGEFNLSNLYGRKVRVSGWLNQRGHLIVRHPNGL